MAVNWWRMNTGIGCFALALALASAHDAEGASVAVDAPSPSTCVDTESVTNLTFGAIRETDRQFNLSLELAATCSNNVEVAFGRDANANGVLDREETAALVGWEAGAWFYRDRRTRTGGRVARPDGRRRLDWRLALDPCREAKSVVATDGDGAVFSGALPRTMFDGAWNMMRVTTRGPSDPQGHVVSETCGWGFKVMLR